MRYELLLQPLDAASTFDVPRVDALLEGRGAKVMPSGLRVWNLKIGPVEVKPLRDGQVQRGLELHVMLSDKTELIRETLSEAAELAKEANLRLYDPQLSRTVGRADEHLVVDQYLRTAKYAGEMLGVSEALGASYGSTPDPNVPKPGTKALMLAVGGLVALYFLMQILNAFRSALTGR